MKREICPLFRGQSGDSILGIFSDFSSYSYAFSITKGLYSHKKNSVWKSFQGNLSSFIKWTRTTELAIHAIGETRKNRKRTDHLNTGKRGVNRKLGQSDKANQNQAVGLRIAHGSVI